MSEKSFAISGIINIESCHNKNNTPQEDTPSPAIPTFDVNMRVDNHTRNAVLALARATADKRTASEMVAILIESYLDKMTPQVLEVYQDFLEMLEQKDKMEYKLKNK